MTFTSRAWLLRVDVGGSLREYCVDASLPLFLSREWRVVALVYPKTSCNPAKPTQGLILDAMIEARDLYDKLAKVCSSVGDLIEELRARRGSTLELLLYRRPTRVEEELYELRNVSELCKLVLGEGTEARLHSYTPAYIAYSEGSSELRRVKSLARVDEGIRVFLERLERGL